MQQCLTEAPRVHRGEVGLLSPAEAKRLAKVANALADPVRVQIVHLLAQRPDLCTCELEELLGLGQSKVSYHLKVLLEAGIVSRETFGTWSHYSLRDQRVLDRLGGLLAEAPQVGATGNGGGPDAG